MSLLMCIVSQLLKMTLLKSILPPLGGLSLFFSFSFSFFFFFFFFFFFLFLFLIVFSFSFLNSRKKDRDIDAVTFTACSDEPFFVHCSYHFWKTEYYTLMYSTTAVPKRTPLIDVRSGPLAMSRGLGAVAATLQGFSFPPSFSSYVAEQEKSFYFYFYFYFFCSKTKPSPNRSGSSTLCRLAERLQ